MANVDRPNGFRAVKTLSGRPVNSIIRTVGVADGADVFVGDAISLTAGLAGRLAVEGVCAGVAVGFGKKNDMENRVGGPVNFDNPMTRYYDDSASTHTDWVCYYIPAEDCIFEAQIDDTAETGVVGEGYDIIVGTGDTATGLSDMEINGDAKTNDGDVVIVEIPEIADNDPTLAFGRYWVKFVNTEFNNV